ncbi:uncharacterized protein LOC120443863 isoform X1 [Drosophila santomea]|uniref:uncharacterized protein LOC120443863 isoform X1 n=1 Tax=Drosophila santomea TaxID=129105 RepID=UPI001CCCC155|nr:uncharacterized protein LOC120443863 isoform X1 [Drosophila santomea]
MYSTEALRAHRGPHFSVDRRRSSRVAVVAGRWLRTYNPNVGVCRRPISPHYGSYAPDGTRMGVLVELLKDATRRSQLDELLLLVAPGSSSHSQKIHCFEKETRHHLGMMPTTESEVDILREYEDMLQYQLRFTNQYCCVKRMTCDRQIIARFFDRSCGGMETEVHPLFESFPNFSYPATAPREFSSVGIQVQMSKPQIRALWKPKIPVHLRNLECIRRSQRILSLTNFRKRSRPFL